MFRRGIMAIFAAVMLLGVCPVQADTEWYSGHHVITDDNEPFGEIYIYNSVTLDILGGDIYKLETFNTTDVNILGGEMDVLAAWDYSIIDIYGGLLETLGSYEDSSVYLYAYDVIYHPTGWEHDPDKAWMEGKYCSDDTPFSFNLGGQDVYSHITVIPEPTTFLLLCLGLLFLRKQN